MPLFKRMVYTIELLDGQSWRGHRVFADQDPDDTAKERAENCYEQLVKAGIPESHIRLEESVININRPTPE